ncbi:BREX-2 system phosphatase PglZ [Streptomyces sp. TRM64462]|uniref:BREX-2 system phosphatase PglZ n=1 Tax=Streptomyces sp. TRM64462 TaxID=2741726 RepID=UPI002814B90B|nr:BREX-2 system phosphatase PglZ [Streptomyces sp. TRM64462]
MTPQARAAAVSRTSTASAASTVRLNTTTITQYLATQSYLRSTTRRTVVLLRAAPVWDGLTEVAWGESRRALVTAAPSPLAVYELVLTHLAADATGPEVLVILTDREEAELGPDVLGQVYKYRVNAVDTWDVVRESFAAQGTDPRLLDDNWAAEALVDAAPPGGWPALDGGLLERRDALAKLARRRLGIGRYDPDRPASGERADVLDVPALLSWSLRPGGPDRYLALRAAEREGLARFLAEDEQAGQAGRALFALVRAEHGADAVPFGLVCAALWSHADAQDDAEVNRARGRAELWLGDETEVRGPALDELACAFGRACEEFVSGLLLTDRSGHLAEGGPQDDEQRSARRMSDTVLSRAASLVRQFGAESAARRSPVLREGLEARFAAAGEAVRSGDPLRMRGALEALREHRLASGPDEAIRIERATMAARLTQWLAEQPETEVPTVADALTRHMRETGWVDMALEHVQAGGDTERELKTAYDELCGAVREKRRAIDRAFARRLAVETEGARDTGSMLTVETFLPEVVAPMVKEKKRRLLLLVLDGMSAAIAAELGEELRESWAEYDPLPERRADDRPRRRAMAAALPTVTAVSRTSLFAARLMRGTQADERRLFPAHRFWGGQEAAVFHKDDLRADSGGDWLGPELLDALESDRTHVAVVLNTVDDRLSSEQKLGDGAWRLSDIGALRTLLRYAAAQGRAVLLTSDHGHVVDRYGERVAAVGVESARHRVPAGPDEPLADAEVRLAGHRVVAPEAGGEIVALWDADARYSAQRAGYHGGAALAEFTIPVLAFLPFGATPPKGWRELGSQRPGWWEVGASGAGAGQPRRTPAAVAVASSVPSVAAVKTTAPKLSKKQAELARSHDSLFDVALVPAAAPAEDDEALLSVELVSPDDALVAALVSSELFEAQLKMLARPQDVGQVERAVHALLDAGGTLPMTALAQRVGLRAPRRPEGFAAMLRQLLNYDGAQVLETLPDGRTVRLNVTLLKDQFGLS